jgi:AraC-like DNA-binding protein
VITQIAAVTDGQIRLGPLMGVPGLLQELGEDPRALIESAGVDPRLFDDPENVIDFAGVGRLLARCAASTARPHFGLLLGRTTGLDALGLLGLLVRHSPDAGAALGNLVLHLLIHDRGAVPVYAIEGSQVLLGYSIYQPRVEGTRQIYDLAVCVGRNVMRTLCGTSWRASEVRLPYRRPVDIEPYRRHFQAPLRFDAERAAVVFPAEVLRCPVQGADPAVYKAVAERVAALEEHGVGDIVAQVRRVLRNLLLSGRGAIDEVAGAFEVHKRTLNRRLRERGISFQELVEETRYHIARQMLRETDLAIVEVAGVLDYADAAAFTRAFRRWSGTTPSAWRAGVRGG